MAESANAAFVRRTYELVNAGDFDTMVEGFEPGFEWHPDELSPGQTTRRTADDVKLAVDGGPPGGLAWRQFVGVPLEPRLKALHHGVEVAGVDQLIRSANDAALADSAIAETA